jgi:hypothetical protein
MTNSLDFIWTKIDCRGPDECWPWLGYKSFSRNRVGGYGRIDVMGRKGVYAHRLAYLAANPGSITLDMKKDRLVLHKCDNPICCNPGHLYLGDYKQNRKDVVDRGRLPNRNGIRNHMAKLTENDVREIRRMKKEGATVKALALLHDVSMATISGCLYGRHYQDIV